MNWIVGLAVVWLVWTVVGSIVQISHPLRLKWYNLTLFGKLICFPLIFQQYLLKKTVIKLAKILRELVFK